MFFDTVYICFWSNTCRCVLAQGDGVVFGLVRVLGGGGLLVRFFFRFASLCGVLP